LAPLPTVTPPRVFAPLRAWRSQSAQRFSLALGSAAVAVFVTLTPRYAVTPELPVSLEQQQAGYATRPTIELPSLMMASDSPRRAVRTLRERPARMIDEALRQRARDAVQRTLITEDVSDPA
jgi:hypothetical protein